jgi:branched-chain amino acid transport system ATP-binding protein
MNESANGRSGPRKAASLLTVEHLTVRYGLATAVRDLSFEVPQGKALALLGVNGSGKSTLARTLSGLVPSAAGKIFFEGHNIATWPAHKIRRAGIVYLPEGRGIFQDLTVAENLRLACGVIKSRSERAQAVERAMDFFPALKARAKNLATTLSGGEQQMLSLARGLATAPKLIVADEMSCGLAPKMVNMVFEALDVMRAQGATIVLIEQLANRALKFADEAVLLQRGELSWHGDCQAATQEVMARYLGETVSAGI